MNIEDIIGYKENFIMNSVNLIGVFGRDPELRYTSTNNTAYCNFSIAVKRKFVKEGQQDTDWITCKAWSKTAEFISKYFNKGKRVGLEGEIRTESYEKDGNTIYTTYVLVNNVEFVESKKSDDNQNTNIKPNPKYENNNNFEPLNEDTELPF